MIDTVLCSNTQLRLSKYYFHIQTPVILSPHNHQWFAMHVYDCS